MRHQAVAQRDVAQGIVFDNFAHNGFDGRHGQRRIGRNGVGILLHKDEQFILRDHAVDQAHGQRFSSSELPSGEKYLLRKRRTHYVHQFAHAIEFVAQPQFGRRHRKTRVVGRNADVTVQSHGHATADAIALNHGQGGFVEFFQGLHASFGHFVVMAGGLRRVTLLGEFRNVSTRDKGLVARPLHHHHANVVIARKFVCNVCQSLPHLQ